MAASIDYLVSLYIYATLQLALRMFFGNVLFVFCPVWGYHEEMIQNLCLEDLSRGSSAYMFLKNTREFFMYEITFIQV